MTVYCPACGATVEVRVIVKSRPVQPVDGDHAVDVIPDLDPLRAHVAVCPGPPGREPAPADAAA